MHVINKTKPQSSFTERVYAFVRTIPCGSTMSYKDVAAAAGSPQAYRRVATLMKQNYDIDIPCHRVIHSDGRIGDYNRGGSEAKRAILNSEKALNN